MKRDPNLCQFVFCPRPWKKFIRSANTTSEMRPLKFCEEHAAPYVKTGRKPEKRTQGGRVTITDREK